MEWKKWEDQGELALLIRCEIDTGSHRELIIENILRDNPNKYTAKEISKKIDELSSMRLILNNAGHIQVTEFSHAAVSKKGGGKSFKESLRRLKAFGVYHKDMLEYGVITRAELPTE